jgi:hypothetical protein
MSCSKELKTLVAKKLAEQSKKELMHRKFRLGTNQSKSLILNYFFGKEHCATCEEASNLITFIRKI